jgi:hypothetical protein
VSTAQAQDFEVDCTLFNGDPNEKPKGVACPRMETRAGQEGSVLVGGRIQIGGRAFTVGRQVRVTAAAAKGGGIQVDATLALAEVIGPNNARQQSVTQVSTSAIIQPGGTMKVELVSDAKEKQWVEITVRKAKR